MSILFFSDIHGSPDSLALLEERIRELAPDKLVLLGDVFLTGGTVRADTQSNRLQTAAFLNRWADHIIAVRGNCDRDTDQKMLNFPMLKEYCTLLVGGQKFFISHGHQWNPGHPPPAGMADVLVNGHTHIPLLCRQEDGLVCFNPGSLSAPRDHHPASFGLYSEQNLSIRRVDRPGKLLALLPL